MHATAVTAKTPVHRNARWSPGSTLGPWKIERQLGEGRWTQVFLASPSESQSPATADYVLKVIKPGLAENSQVIGMLQREAFVSQCVSHPHLSCVLAAHVDSPPMFLVMPFQAGTTLADLLASFTRLPLSKALWIARQAAEALAALHAADWLHGDIKPDNIFVAINGHVTVCDLGFARRLAEAQNRREFVLGTPAYLAPELVSESVPVSPSADVYALGITLFEMLTGNRPFDQCEEAELAAAHRLLPPPDPRATVPYLPPHVCRLLRQMLAKEPLRRPVGVELIQLLVDLEIDAFDMRD